MEKQILTPTLKNSLNYLKEVGVVFRIQNYSGTPHEFTGPNETFKMCKNNWRIESPPYNRRINRQTLNKLILLGYARYTNKEKTAAEYIDKEAIDAENERLIRIAIALENALKEGWHLQKGPDEHQCYMQSTESLIGIFGH